MTTNVLDTSVFDGLRVLFNYIVVHGHVLYYFPLQFSSPGDWLNLHIRTSPSLFLLTVFHLFLVYHSVDVFLFVSGYLFASSFLRRRHPPRIHHVFAHVVHRFLRLFPVYVIAWAVSVARGSTTCKDPSVVLYEAFHVINFSEKHGTVPGSQSMCMIVAWSLSTDIQAHFIMAVTLTLLYYLFPLSSSPSAANNDTHKNKKSKEDGKTRQEPLSPPRFTAVFMLLLTLIQVISRYNFVHALNRPLARNISVVNIALYPEDLTPIAAVSGLTPSPSLASALQHGTKLSNANNNLVNDMLLYASPKFRTAPAYLGLLLWVLLYKQRNNRNFWVWVRRNSDIMVKTAVSGMSVLFVFFVAVPRMLMNNRVQLSAFVAVLVAMYESLYRVFFTFFVALFVIAVGMPSNTTTPTNNVVVIDSQGNKNITTDNDSTNKTTYTLTGYCKLLLFNKIVKALAPLSYSVYLMHPFVLSVAANFWPNISSDSPDLWRFVPGGMLVYAVSVGVSVPCHWAERMFHRVRRAAIKIVRGKVRGEAGKKGDMNLTVPQKTM